jgi:hypothetical protein
MEVGDLVKFEGADLSKGSGRMLGIIVPWKSVDEKIQWPPEHEMFKILWSDGDTVAFKKKRLEVVS